MESEVIHQCVFSIGEIFVVFNFGDLSLRNIDHSLLSIVCLHSGDSMLFRLWTEGPKGKVFSLK